MLGQRVLVALLVLVIRTSDFHAESFTIPNCLQAYNRLSISLQPRLPRASTLWITIGDEDKVSASKNRDESSKSLIHNSVSAEPGINPRLHSIQSEDDVFRLMEAIGGRLPQKYNRTASTRTFNLVLRELAAAGEPWAGLRAEEIFVYMLEQHLGDDTTSIQPDTVTFNSVLRVWAASQHPENAARAHTFLDGLDELHDRGLLLDLKSDSVSYNIVISAYQRSSQRGIKALQNAELVFNELVELYETTRDPRYRPDVVTFCSILNAASSDAVHAEQLLLQMYKNRNNLRVCPDSSCFEQVIRAWAQKGGERGARRAEMILRLMEDMADDVNSPVKPRTETYNVVLFALKNSGEIDAPIRAQMIMEQMKSNPDEITYTTIISVWCRLGGRQSLEYTQKLLDEAIQNPNINVEVPFFANVLSSLSSCSQKRSIVFAETLVEKKMPSLGLQPDINVWNALLNCYAKRGMGTKAEETLSNLESVGGLGSIRPNQETYSIVLDALAKSDAPDSISNAESVIERMQSSSSIQPDVRAYTALIQKYARSNVPMKAKRAQEVLEEMKNGPMESRPTVVTYNAVLNACEYTPTSSTYLNEKQEAFTIACMAFDEVRKILQPSHVTYGSFLGVISNLMPGSSARADIVELVFKRCCQDGQVSPFVLRRLKEAAGPAQYRKMLSGQSEERLPNRWTVNVEERRGQQLVSKRQSPRNYRMLNKKRKMY